MRRSNEMMCQKRVWGGASQMVTVSQMDRGGRSQRDIPSTLRRKIHVTNQEYRCIP